MGLVSQRTTRRRAMLLISFAGALELYRSAGLVWATGEEPMSDDPDFPTANHALQVLRQARLSRNEVAALKLWDLAHAMADTGLRTPEVEQAHQAALVAISALAKSLEQEGFARLPYGRPRLERRKLGWNYSTRARIAPTAVPSSVAAQSHAAESLLS